MLYDQFFIDELKDRADLVRIIEPYAPLKKKGANWMGCCPFHQEKTPSFSVNPAKGFYKCFGCGKGGTAFNFLMEMEGLNFPEAVARVAQMAGVPLPEPIDDESYQAAKKKRTAKKELAERVIELNRIALDFWEKELQKRNAKATAAREYLETRGVSAETKAKFRIGYSPDSWDSLHKLLTESGADSKLIEQSGLVSVNEEKDRVFDRFRGRIMFPILDLNGDPVAFGARAMGSDEPKYLNSPETPAYVKGRHLYGLFQSREAIRQKKFAILVEGYLDLIALHQFGITNAAASLGTAFTPEQSKLLSRFTKNIVINYDGDNAGVKAARKAVESLLADELEVKVLVLPNGQDPDDFLRANGAESYNRIRGDAQPFLRFVLDAAAKGKNLTVAKHKADAIEEVLPVIASIRNPIQKRESFDQAMNFFRVDDPSLKREIWNNIKKAVHLEGDIARRQARKAAKIKITVAEQHLLELLIFDRELRSIILPQLQETDFEPLATSAVFTALLELNNREADPTLELLLELCGDDESAADFVPLLMMGEARRDPDEAIDNVQHDAENCLLTLRLMAISSRIAEISQEAIMAEQSGQDTVRNRLTFEQLELEKIKRSLLNRIRQT